MSDARIPLVAELAEIVGARGLLAGDEAAPYEVGARYGRGKSLCVVRPACTEEVQQVVRACARHGARMVVQGGNTGLVGASTPDASGQVVVLSTGRLRSTCAISVADRTATVDAGFTLHELNERLLPHGLWFPIDLGANPLVGGMVATNTGGTRLIRYGDVRHNLLAVEVVLFDPPGERVRFGRALRKDNTGLDLKQLFVGTAGACGVITAAIVEVHARPAQSATALVAPANEEAVIGLLEAAERELGDFLSAFEGISASALQAAITHVPRVACPFDSGVPEFALLIELESSSSPALTGLDLQETLNRFLQNHFEGLISDAVVGRGEDLWRLRHAISEGLRPLGRTIAFDVSVPRSRLMAFRRAARAMVEQHHPQLAVYDFGHVADGGLHFNVVWPQGSAAAYDEAAVADLRDRLYELVMTEFEGSFSAEHGIGPHNARYYRRYTASPAQALAGRIQSLLDPRRMAATMDWGRVGQDAKGALHP